MKGVVTLRLSKGDSIVLQSILVRNLGEIDRQARSKVLQVLQEIFAE